MPKKLGEILVEDGIITKEQLLTGLKYQTVHGGMLGEALIATKAIPDENVISRFLTKQLKIGKLSLNDIEFDPDVINLIPYDIAQKYTIIAINKTNRTLSVAISDPKNIFMLDAVKFLTSCAVKPVLASAREIQDAINQNYNPESGVDNILNDMKNESFEVVAGEKEPEPEDIAKEVSEAPVVKLVNHLILEAVRKNVSDIHIETYQRILRVRYRIDGKLIEMSPLPYRLRTSVISRIKIMAELDISERRLPQDGRIKIKTGPKTVDLRVSTTPTIFGEKVVMRILDSSNLMLDMADFGIPEKGLFHIKEALNAPYGMVLVTGPTGSGKSTTLYSALSRLNQPDINIMTAEDPVEYNIDGINQINVHSDIGLTFAAALRSFLRQDPDVVMVGEIRDLETAEISVKAALTGHLVLSTLHTNDSASTLTRLIDMGVDSFLAASSVRLIVAQRLIRLICTNCKEQISVEDNEFVPFLKLPLEEVKNLKLFKGQGCQLCNNTGYKGRCGLYEVLPITLDIQELVMDKAPPHIIKKKALEDGMLSLRMCGLEKMKKGLTTIEEIIGATA
ncbi:type IV-A pilus assembly ATPase PilB [Chitinispirillales bacterium ANBcel5]|uniref:type IV-A pilus assembly ATPase PilB n=1 Tax=Cellulosispirillum alkaliphilum TaxID=3039283 RepID=UPI002A528772|nr:type IV-A pilus assembly ATPase PilB [Chitinispirillales bacterium ANBcel5]